MPRIAIGAFDAVRASSSTRGVEELRRCQFVEIVDARHFPRLPTRRSCRVLLAKAASDFLSVAGFGAFGDRAQARCRRGSGLAAHQRRSKRGDLFVAFGIAPRRLLRAADWPPKPRHRTAIMVVKSSQMALCLLIFSFIAHVHFGHRSIQPPKQTGLFGQSQ